MLAGLAVEVKGVVPNVLETHLRCAIGQVAARGARNIAVHMRGRAVMEVGEGNALVMPLKIQTELAPGRNTVVKTMFSYVVMVHVVTHFPIPKDGVVALRGNSGRNALRITQRCATLKNAAAIIAVHPWVDAKSWV